MNYREVYKAVCKHAAEHLDSLDIYDEFGDEDADRIERAICEIQGQLLRKAGDNQQEWDEYETGP